MCSALPKPEIVHGDYGTTATVVCRPEFFRQLRREWKNRSCSIKAFLQPKTFGPRMGSTLIDEEIYLSPNISYTKYL